MVLADRARPALGLAVAAIVLLGLLPATASAAELRPAGALRVQAAGTHSIHLRWRDRSSGERRYEIQARLAGADRWSRARTGADSGAITLRRLERGRAYEARVRACKRRRCAPWGGRRARAATLLAPFSGPHPDLRCASFPASEAFNRDVSSAPVDPRSRAIISQINADGEDFLHPDFGSRGVFHPETGYENNVIVFARALKSS